MLDAAHVPLAGIILNEVTRESSYGYGYYGYGGYSSYREKDGTKPEPSNWFERVPRPALNGNGVAHRNGSHTVAGADEAQVSEEQPS
jgi:hypothetical protein